MTEKTELSSTSICDNTLINFSGWGLRILLNSSKMSESSDSFLWVLKPSNFLLD